jgi:chromosome segregation ATPase
MKTILLLSFLFVLSCSSAPDKNEPTSSTSPSRELKTIENERDDLDRRLMSLHSRIDSARARATGLGTSDMAGADAMHAQDDSELSRLQTEKMNLDAQRQVLEKEYREAEQREASRAAVLPAPTIAPAVTPMLKPAPK